MLLEVLNRLGAPAREREAFMREALKLSPSERLEAAVLHIGALLEALPDKAEGSCIRFGALETEVMETNDAGDVSYEDVGASFRADGVHVAFNDGPHSMASFLELLLHARDRSDALLYLPADMRQDRIEALAEQTGSAARFVRYILAHAPAIERKLAA